MNINGTATASVFLLYTRHQSGKAMMLGPAFTDLDACQSEMDVRRAKGLDSTWVEIALDNPDFGGWIAETKGERPSAILTADVRCQT